MSFVSAGDYARIRAHPPECIVLAIARVARINAAYDRLAKGRARLA